MMTVKTRYEGPQGIYLDIPKFDVNQHFSEVVYENYSEFSGDTGDKRKMFNAVVSLWHFHEILYWHSDKLRSVYPSLSLFRQYVRTQSTHFDYAEAICIFYKHAVPTKNKSVLEIAENIVDVALRLVELVEGSATLSDPSHSPRECTIDFTKPYKADENITMRLKDGSQIKIIEIATSLNELWGEILSDLEIANKPAGG